MRTRVETGAEVQNGIFNFGSLAAIIRSASEKINASAVISNASEDGGAYVVKSEIEHEETEQSVLKIIEIGCDDTERVIMVAIAGQVRGPVGRSFCHGDGPLWFLTWKQEPGR